MSGYKGYYTLQGPLTPEETWEQRAEAFRRAMSDVDQAGDMLAVERARAARWKQAAKDMRAWALVNRESIDTLIRERDEARAVLSSAMDEFLQVSRERDEARERFGQVQNEQLTLSGWNAELVRDRERWKHQYFEAVIERDEARAVLMKRITRDAA